MSETPWSRIRVFICRKQGYERSPGVAVNVVEPRLKELPDSGLRSDITGAEPAAVSCDNKMCGVFTVESSIWCRLLSSLSVSVCACERVCVCVCVCVEVL